MKMVRSLLLGSAAGVVAVAGAQAADLPVKAKPVEYVKICSLYGDGFFYIPGTETCVRIGGSVMWDFFYNARGNGHPQYDAADGAQDRTTNSFNSRGHVQFGFDSRTQTAYGTLRSFGVLKLENQDIPNVVNPNVPRAFIQWAGFTFGHTKSFTDPVASWGGGSDFKNMTQAQIHADTGANGTNQISYSWELGNGMVLVFGANERRSNSIANLSNLNTVTVGAAPVSSRAGQIHPDPYVAWRGAQSWGSWSAAIIAVDNSALYDTGNNPVLGAVPCPAPAQVGTTQCAYPSDKWGFAWLSGIQINLPMIAQGDRIGGFFNYGVGAGQHSGGVNVQSPGLFQGGNNVALGVKTDGVYVNGSGLQLTTSWSFGAAYEHYWMPNFSTTVYAGRSSIEYSDTVINSRAFCGGSGAAVQRIVVDATTRCDPGFKVWQMGTHSDWYPVPGFRLAAEVGYTFVETAFDGRQVTLTATQGARPTGVYLAKDAGIVTVVARAQRGFGGIGE